MMSLDFQVLHVIMMSISVDRLLNKEDVTVRVFQIQIQSASFHPHGAAISVGSRPSLLLLLHVVKQIVS